MHKITKKILAMAMLLAVLSCGLIFTACGELETDENVYTITFIAVYSVKETITERRVSNPSHPEDGDNGKILAEGEVYTGRGEVKELSYEAEVYYDLYAKDPREVIGGNKLKPGEVDVAARNQGKSFRTDGTSRLKNFPPNPVRPGDYGFDGWYTIGGTRVTEQTIFTTNTRVMARWKAGASIGTERGRLFLKFEEISEALKNGWALSEEDPDAVTVTIEANESLKPITLEVKSPSTRNVHIILDGGVIDGDTKKPRYFLTISESGSLFTVGGNVKYTYNVEFQKDLPEIIGSVTLELRNARMEGNDRNTKSLLTVNDGGKLIIGENSSDRTYITLNGAEDERSGGAVTVNKGGELIMNGGDIYQCSVHARPYDDPNGWPGGGGVNVRGGTFTMYGGNIERCFGSINGGAVLVDLGGRFTMKGGQLYDNSAPYGGGVSTYRGGLFIMEEGDGPVPTIPIIKENLAREGGAIFVDAGAEHNYPYDPRKPLNFPGMNPFEHGNYYDNTKYRNDPARMEGFYMRGGVIQDNHSLADGGAIYNYAGGIVYMTGGMIRTNIADDFGGGVMNMGLFIMINGDIHGNRARYGGGVMAGLNMFAFEAGNITHNRATVAGGGVFVLEGSFFMLGDNARLGGAGTYNPNGSGLGNYADSFAGGVVIYPTGNFCMAGGIITGNSAYNSQWGTMDFFDSTDPKLLGLAIYGFRPPNPTPGDPIIDHIGSWYKNPVTQAWEWEINSYLVNYDRNPVTRLVENLSSHGNGVTIEVKDGHLTVAGVKPSWVTYPEERNQPGFPE